MDTTSYIVGSHDDKRGSVCESFYEEEYTNMQVYYI